MSYYPLQYKTFDVFTSEKYKGNPLAIVHAPQYNPLPQEEKQIIAREFNYSETVFLHPSDSSKEWTIDIFTTHNELPFAGHPTIGSAYYLGTANPAVKELTLITKAGRIPITYERDADGSCTATASVPHNTHLHEAKVTREHVLTLQPSLQPKAEQLDSEFPLMSITDGMSFSLLRLDSPETLQLVQASTREYLKSYITLDEGWSPLHIGTYFYYMKPESSSNKYYVSCRMIYGSLEDPATGSAASTLAAFLATDAYKKGTLEGEALDIEVEQGVDMGRRSVIRLRVELNDSGVIQKILLTGTAVQVMDGTIH